MDADVLERLVRIETTLDIKFDDHGRRLDDYSRRIGDIERRGPANSSRLPNGLRLTPRDWLLIAVGGVVGGGGGSGLTQLLGG